MKKDNRLFFIALFLATLTMLGWSIMLFVFENSAWHLALLVINIVVFFALVIHIFVYIKIKKGTRKIDIKEDEEKSKYDKLSFNIPMLVSLVSGWATFISILLFYLL